jgi:hypothetical protein
VFNELFGDIMSIAQLPQANAMLNSFETLSKEIAQARKK